jgi:hypothetical protein
MHFLNGRRRVTMSARYLKEIHNYDGDAKVFVISSRKCKGLTYNDMMKILCKAASEYRKQTKSYNEIIFGIE